MHTCCLETSSLEEYNGSQDKCQVTVCERYLCPLQASMLQQWQGVTAGWLVRMRSFCSCKTRCLECVLLQYGLLRLRLTLCRSE